MNTKSDRDVMLDMKYDLAMLLLSIKRDVNKINRRIITMAATVQDLQDAITAIGTQVDSIATSLTDFSGDFAAAIKKLQDAIAAGVNLDPAVTALSAMAPKLTTLATSLSDLDTTAEGITGVKTP